MACFSAHIAGKMGGHGAQFVALLKAERHGAFGTGCGDGHATPSWVLQSALRRRR